MNGKHTASAIALKLGPAAIKSRRTYRMSIESEIVGRVNRAASKK